MYLIIYLKIDIHIINRYLNKKRCKIDIYFVNVKKNDRHAKINNTIILISGLTRLKEPIPNLLIFEILNFCPYLFENVLY